MSVDNKRSYHELRAVACAQIPKIFTPRGTAPVPLEIGIGAEIKERLSAFMSENEFKMFMPIWVGRPEYLLSLYQSPMRHSIEGKATSHITLGERENALQRLANFIRRKSRSLRNVSNPKKSETFKVLESNGIPVEVQKLIIDIHYPKAKPPEEVFHYEV